jgi:hypothetical protein
MTQFGSRSSQQPVTRAELTALEARRDELSDQLKAVTQRRGMLAQERLNAEARADAGGNQDRLIVRELEQQVTELGQRSIRLQRELASAEDAIAAARARPVVQGGGEGSLLPAQVLRGSILVPPRGENDALLRMKYERLMLMEALAFVLLGVVGARLLWRSATRRAQRATPVEGLTQVHQALDVIAVEVERIAENQRYVTKMLTEQAPGDKVVAAARKEPERR